jgi:SAM-dependent methyltransferase
VNDKTMREASEMTVRNLVRPIPGVRWLSIARQRLSFTSSADFWERNYKSGGTSGGGSYGALAHGKAKFLNAFVAKHEVRSVMEFGCGDGHQLSLARYPMYVGLDVSRSAIELCKERFSDDLTKSFFLYDGNCFVDRAQLFGADLAISLDVIYHLVEDSVFESHMDHLFGVGRRFVIIYSTNMISATTGPHVRHREISPWIEKRYPSWQLVQMERAPDSRPGRPDFFVYEHRP